MVSIADMDIRAIAAVSKTDGGIGLNGTIPWKNTDLAFFREQTEDDIVIMGGRTVRADPRLANLKHRKVHVWDRVGGKIGLDPGLFLKDIMQPYDYWPRKPTIWIAGGEETYRTFAPFVKYMSITPIQYNGLCDTYFPFDAYYNIYPVRNK